jgi:hypothetical protein
MRENSVTADNGAMPSVIGLPVRANSLAEHSSPSSQTNLALDTGKLIHEAKVIGECYRVRVLFDTEHLKSDKDYIAIIEDTWLKTFKDTDPELLAEAVQNFIVADKKGYLPKPGQIVEFLVKETKAIERRRYYAEFERLERQRLFEQYGNKE